jgi:hypothetical protein
VGFLGTLASPFTDANLVLQLAIIAILMLARHYARRGNLRNHGLAMATAVSLNAVAIATVMVPSLLLGAGALIADPLMPLSALSIAHAIVGGASEAVGAWIVLSWGPESNYKRCVMRRGIMVKLLIAWLAAAVTGVIFYLAYYVAPLQP